MKTVSIWYSPSKSAIQINKLPDASNCGSNISVKVSLSGNEFRRHSFFRLVSMGHLFYQFITYNLFTVLLRGVCICALTGGAAGHRSMTAGFKLWVGFCQKGVSFFTLPHYLW